MRIAMVSFNKFPNGDAGALREYSFAKLLQSLGHKVCVLGMGHAQFGVKKTYQEIEYISLRKAKKNLITKFKNYFGYSSRLKKQLKELYSYNKLDIIWVVDIPVNALLMVKKYAKRNNIMIVHDSVEWYSPQQFKFGLLSPAYLMKDFYNRILIDKQFKVIAISKFLEKHFRSRNIPVIRIPVIFDFQEINYTKTNIESKLVILYAGSPGKKDYLKEMLEGIALLDNNDLLKIEVRLLGVNYDDIGALVNIKSLDYIRDCMKIFGRVSREMVLENLENTDFTIMLRSPELRYAKAGFPTKVVESLATGTPVITNISSDLGDYLTDLVNSIVVETCSPESFYSAIVRVLKLSEKQLDDLKQNARITADQNFDLKLYKEKLSDFIEK